MDHLPDMTASYGGKSAESGADIAPAFSDESLALQFTERHGSELRYVAAWGQWLEATGSVWQPDNTLRIFDRARGICRQAAAECNKPTQAASISSAKTVAAVERLARSDRRHAATVEQWDADPWLLNTPGGTIELRTGKMRGTEQRTTSPR